MATVYIVRLMKQFFPVGILVMAVVCGMIFAPGTAKAEDPTPSEAALAEMKKMLGGVPAEMQLYPESARAAGWESGVGPQQLIDMERIIANSAL